MIKISSKPKDWVGDLFSGSGGTLRACRELGRNCISIEINSQYFPIIKQKAMLNRKIVFNTKENSELKMQLTFQDFF